MYNFPQRQKDHSDATKTAIAVFVGEYPSLQG